jgi:uncharacterized protein YqjF (DUF2071 family)
MATTSRTPTKSVAKTKPLMKARYSDLVAINFQVDAKILRPLVPPGLELDFYNGETYVSLIAMMLKNVKIWGLPFPLVPSSPELSLRFYVQRKIGDEVEKGACLIKDYISGSTAAWFLESQFKTEFAKMKIKCQSSGFGENVIPEVEYQWKVNENWNKLRVRARSRIKSGPNPMDTKVGFILEHNNYFGTFEGKTVAYRVERPKWEIWDAAQANFTCDVSQLFGKKFVKPLAKRPASVFVTGGSAVTVYKPVVVG